MGFEIRGVWRSAGPDPDCSRHRSETGLGAGLRRTIGSGRTIREAQRELAPGSKETYLRYSRVYIISRGEAGDGKTNRTWAYP